jgi:glycosyltransferase involved in cell wall biosynthesis
MQSPRGLRNPPQFATDMSADVLIEQTSSVQVDDRRLTAAAVKLSIIMPCLNEACTLASCVRKAQSFERTGISGEIIIADNGSSDGSQEIAHELGARVVNVRTRGYGAALCGGIAAAWGRYCIMADSDDSYDFEKLDNFVEKLRAGYDIVVGNRFQGGIKKGAMPWKHRYLGTPGQNVLPHEARRLQLRHARLFQNRIRAYGLAQQWDGVRQRDDR